jgi:peptidoglycan/xylan/chitin deacetylase (PgdA/CDA1 family)
VLLAISAHAQNLALTFDDGLNPHTQPQASAWNQSILDALAKANVKSMLMLACKNVESAEGMALVREWGRAGHLIANHTYSHLNLSSQKISAQTFIADVKKCDEILRGVDGFTPRLRFPYLKEWDSVEQRDAVRKWMTQNGYRPAPVSIDASDWYYADRFVAWRKTHPSADFTAYRDAYLAHLWDRANYYDGLAKRVLKRTVKHVMLLHTNAINAQFLPDVVAMFRSRGWTIVSAKEAFNDPVYASVPSAMPAGESIIWALAKQAGLEGLRYPAESEEYEQSVLDEVEARMARIQAPPEQPNR